MNPNLHNAVNIMLICVTSVLLIATESHIYLYGLNMAEKGYGIILALAILINIASIVAWIYFVLVLIWKVPKKYRDINPPCK